MLACLVQFELGIDLDHELGALLATSLTMLGTLMGHELPLLVIDLEPSLPMLETWSSPLGTDLEDELVIDLEPELPTLETWFERSLEFDLEDELSLLETELRLLGTWLSQLEFGLEDELGR